MSPLSVDSVLRTTGVVVHAVDAVANMVERACSGDRSALGELYQHYADAVYRYMFYRTSDPVIAEDLTSDVFVRMVEGIASYEDRGLPFSAWLFTIARARLIDHWRWSGRKRVVSLDDTTRDALVDEHDPIERALSDQRLAKLLQHLTDDQQDVIILKFVQGLENTEVAHVLNKNEGAVKSLQHRALRRLARVMAESHSHQDEERATA